MSEDATPAPAAADGQGAGDQWPPDMPTSRLTASRIPTGETRIAEPQPADKPDD